MRVTDEMVDAAIAADSHASWWAGNNREGAEKRMRAALEAALAVEGTEAKPVAWIWPDAFERLRRGDSPRETAHADTYMRGAIPLYTTPPAGIREALERDAARWNALLRCARIEVRGSAGFDPKTGKRRHYDNASRAMVDGAKGWVHFSADFWSEYPGHEDADKKGRWGTVALTALADEVIRKDNEESDTALRGQS